MKKIIIILTSIALITLVSCKNSNNKWVNTNINGNYSAERPSVKDDFYQAINYDSICNSNSVNYSIYSGFQNEITKLLNNQITELYKNNNANYNLETKQFLKLYEKCIDWNKRDRDGLSPIIPIINKINSIESVSDFETLFEDDIFRLFFPLKVNLKYNNGHYYTPLIDINYIFDKYPEVYKEFFNQMFLKLGYTETDTEELINKAYEFEKLYNSSYVKNELIPNSENVTTLKLKTEIKNLPLLSYLKSYGIENLTYAIARMNAFQSFDRNFTEDNLEAIKALCICKVFAACSQFLDKDTFILYSRLIDEKIYGKKLSYSNDELTVKIFNSFIPEYTGKIWYTNFCSDELMVDVAEFASQILENYKKQINEWNWLYSGSKYNLIEMLNNVKIIIGHSSFYDYSNLVIKESFCNSMLEAIKNEKKIQARKCYEDLDRYEWYQPVQNCNAYYRMDNNSINIFAGYIYACKYNKNSSYEEKLASLGFVISHEISHILCVYNYDGSLIHKLMTFEDHKYLENKLMQISKQFSTYEVMPGINCNGEFCKGEIGADYFAMDFILKMVKDSPNFNYREFFEKYAKINFLKYPENIQRNYINTDTHPPYYLRVNGILQYFNEFYTVYDIHKKDGMYLPEKNRIKF